MEDITVRDSLDFEGEDEIKKERPLSVNLLDMNEDSSVQSNEAIIANQLAQCKMSEALKDNSSKATNNENKLDRKEESKKADKSKIPYISIQKFDPLQPNTDEKEAAPTAEDKPSAKVTPTRLPTPRRTALSSHVSADPIPNNNNNTNNSISKSCSTTTNNALNPTPPSSPGRRVRHTSIARLVKAPVVRESSVGKANRELAEFDPLISPVQAKRLSSNNDDTIKNHKDLLTSEKLEETNHCMKQVTPPKSNTNINTRIPIPPKTRHEAKELDETQKHDQVSTIPSKLRKPEVIVPKSIKNGTFAKNDKEMPMSFVRRPSYPTAANEILQEQWDKEREKSRRLSANLISAQGLISQPEDITDDGTFKPVSISRSASHESRMEKIHDRLQCLVDVGIPESDNESEPVEYKKENGNIEVMNAKTALNRYRPFLSPFERTEIMRYPTIYYVGSNAKKIMASTDQTALNYGYDDEKGDYLISMKDHLAYRYEIVESLGKGSFGQVVKCRDHKPANDAENSNNFVAIKIIRNKKRFQAQAQTEVKILEKLMSWDPKNKHYIVRMLDSFYFRDHLCIAFECLSLNLYEVLQQNNYQGFSMGLVKRFAYQILTSLKLLNEHNVIHCDLKPENILLRQPDRSGIRVIDYGSSCYANEKVFTYIQSRFYRAPEVMLGMDYGMPIDMWSTGCILAELYTGRPLFPGENEPDQLACVMQLIGVPEKQYLDRCARRKVFFDTYDQPRKSINSKGKKRRPNSLRFTEVLRRSSFEIFDRDFMDFISRCLTWEPEERMKPAEALNHPWIQAKKH